MDNEISFEASCPCGRAISQSDLISDIEIIVCPDCKQSLGTYEELKSQAVGVWDDTISRIINGEH